MIRKVTRIDAPVAVVREMFVDTDLWPQWMPGVAATRTLEKTAGRHLAEVVLQVLGRRMVQQLECREDNGRVLHRQVAGRFKKWDATWDFTPRPEDGATTLSLDLDFDLGLARLLVPRRLLSNWVSSLIQDTMDQARERAQRLARGRREPTQAVHLGEPFLQIFETADGFEVCFAGRTFHVDARDPPAQS